MSLDKYFCPGHPPLFRFSGVGTVQGPVRYEACPHDLHKKRCAALKKRSTSLTINHYYLLITNFPVCVTPLVVIWYIYMPGI
jgi:hypothetical protein